jgi:hypothetical protein
MLFVYAHLTSDMAGHGRLLLFSRSSISRSVVVVGKFRDLHQPPHFWLSILSVNDFSPGTLSLGTESVNFVRLVTLRCLGHTTELFTMRFFYPDRSSFFVSALLLSLVVCVAFLCPDWLDCVVCFTLACHGPQLVTCVSPECTHCCSTV